jgi:hypothetical protein
LTLFGTPLDAEKIAALVALLTALVYWIFVLRNERNGLTAFRKWEADRKARRDAEIALEKGEAAPPPSSPPQRGPKRGPWG